MSAISDYFRTALVIDDNFVADFGLEDGVSEENEASQNEDMPVEPTADLEAPEIDKDGPIYPSQLVSSFLAQKIVCSLLEIKKGETDLVQKAVLGAESSDILIIDWYINKEYSATIDAIRAVSEEHRGRLTVIVVYSSEPNLNNIVDQLIQDGGFIGVDQYILSRYETMVLVFGKSSKSNEENEGSRAADYSALPKRIRQDLEDLFSGIMPEFAFRAINTIRDSVPRVLATFNSSLDAGALTHRALLKEPDEAGSHFVRLLVGDFEQALTERDVGSIWNTESMEGYIKGKRFVNRPTLVTAKLKNNAQFSAELKALDNQKMANATVVRGVMKTGIKKPNDATIAKLVASLRGGRRSNESLALLMNSTSFRAIAPRLELGIVLQDESRKYWLCLQPLCDSVRLPEVRNFPLIPLRKFVKGNDKHPDAMIEERDGRVMAVMWEQHPYKLSMQEFSRAEGGTVVAEGEAPYWHFRNVEGKVYQAITRLRPEVASDALHGFVSQVSRVGVDLSEWLRMGAVS